MRNAHIDRLRGIAIAMVILGHSPRFIGEWQPIPPLWVYNHIVTGAYFGVSIFFVISGYLITSKFIVHGSGPLAVNARKFYIQRISRIVPPLALMILVSAGIAMIQGAHIGALNLVNAMLALLQIDISAAGNLIPHTDSSWDALWSLRIEELFYIFLPIFALILVTQQRLSLFLMGAVAVGLFNRTQNHADIYSFYSTFDQLSIGGLTAIYRSRARDHIPHGILIAGSVLAALGLLAVYLTAAPTDAPSSTAVALCAAALIIAMPSMAASRAIFWPLESLGRLSYEVYLTHMMILWALAPLGRMTLQTTYPHASAAALLAASFLLCYAVGYAFSALYSEPLNRAARRLLLGEPDTRVEGPSAIVPASSPAAE